MKMHSNKLTNLRIDYGEDFRCFETFSSCISQKFFRNRFWQSKFIISWFIMGFDLVSSKAIIFVFSYLNNIFSFYGLMIDEFFGEMPRFITMPIN